MKEDALNIVIGTILSVQKVDNSEKLFLVRIDVGNKIVQIATSLASFFKAGELIGKQVPVKIDVTPRNIRGVLSDARFIAIMGENHEPILVIPEKTVKNGAMLM